MYDYLVVGAGLFGSVFAHEATKRGFKCLVIDRRDHLGGNIHCENVDGINVHKYGAHIFHTNSKEIWDYVNQFVEFNNYVNSPVARYKDKLYSLPFNMNTFYQIWGTKNPAEAKERLAAEQEKNKIENPKNLEEQAISLVGEDIYKILIRGYTKKQWGRDPLDLPASIIKRLPVRYTFNNNYFNDRFQGIPMGGYNKLYEGLLEGVETKTSCDFFENREEFESKAKKIVYTGQIDELFGYEFGPLEYRSLKFENERLEIDNFQGNAVVNYTEEEVPYTRILEHKHFEFGEQDHTVITKEYPLEWEEGAEPYYPINDDKNKEKLAKYQEKAKSLDNLILGGRLAEYKYYDMHQVIGSALACVRKEFN